MEKYLSKFQLSWLFSHTDIYFYEILKIGSHEAQNKIEIITLFEFQVSYAKYIYSNLSIIIMLFK